MIKLLGVLFLVVVSLNDAAKATLHPKGKRFVGFREGNYAAGLVLGEPSGLRVHYLTGWKSAWAGTVGYSLNKVIRGSIDYLIYGYSTRDKVINENFWNSLIFYFGPGILGGYGLTGSEPEDNYQFGIRVVGGSEYIFTDSPWSVRVELAPQLFFKGKHNFDLGMVAGITYYFDSKKDNSRKYQKDSSETPGRTKPASDDEMKEFE